jgi:hypothetical protein
MLSRVPARPSVAAYALVLGAASACSSSPVTEVVGFTASPLVTTQTSAGVYDVDVRTSPQPPVVGLTQAQLVVKDHATGRPVDGLSIGVVPWMPAMGHGTSLVPTVSASGDGVYTIDQLSLFMAGEWELRLSFERPDGGDGHDTANPAFDVP